MATRHTDKPENPTAAPLTYGPDQNPTAAPMTVRRENPGVRKKGKRGGQDEANNTNTTNGEGNKKARKKPINEAHSLVERERRGRMKVKYNELKDLVPQLPHKADKIRIVDEATNYIKTLEVTLNILEKKKLEKVQTGAICSSISSYYNESSSSPATANIDNISTSDDQSGMMRRPTALEGDFELSTWVSPNVVLSIAGGDRAYINICCTKRVQGFLTSIAYFLETYSCLHLVSLQLSSDQHRFMYIINVRANAFVEGLTSGDEVKNSLERIFKQFASDIMTYIENSQ